MDRRNTENLKNSSNETQAKRGWKTRKVAGVIKFLLDKTRARVRNTNNDRDFCFILFTSVNYFLKSWDKRLIL